MKYTVSMKYNRDFKRLYNRGQSIAAGYLVLYYRKNFSDKNIMGITVTKKIGKAHVRNKIRRRIRECYRKMEESILCGYNFVVVARTRASSARYEQIERDMCFLLKKSGMLKEQ